jgi:hypothetical protein
MMMKSLLMSSSSTHPLLFLFRKMALNL